MRKQISLLLVLGVLAVMAISGPANAAAACIGNKCTYSDTTSNASTTIEPVLVKAEAQVNDPLFRTAALGGANIQSFEISADNGFITTKITTKDPLVTCSTPYPGVCSGAAAPYGGYHVMVMFQTPELATTGATGCADAACTGDAQWTPILEKDRFNWFMYYGATQSEGKPDASLGVYDPTGRIIVPIVSGRASAGISAAPLEPGAGQVFGVMGQRFSDCDNNTPLNPENRVLIGDQRSSEISFDPATSITNGGKTVTLKVPYNYHWRGPLAGANPCAGRHKVIYKPGQKISNAVAFAWTDHEIGGPDPVGLILGWTWYMDSVPALQSTNPGGYKVGTPAGDPNSPAIAGPACPFVTRSVDNPAGGPPLLAGGNRNPLWVPGAPCTLPNPVGPGFVPSGFVLTNPD